MLPRKRKVGSGAAARSGESSAEEEEEEEETSSSRPSTPSLAASPRPAHSASTERQTRAQARRRTSAAGSAECSPSWPPRRREVESEQTATNEELALEALDRLRLGRASLPMEYRLPHTMPVMPVLPPSALEVEVATRANRPRWRQPTQGGEEAVAAVDLEVADPSRRDELVRSSRRRWSSAGTCDAREAAPPTPPPQPDDRRSSKSPSQE